MSDASGKWLLVVIATFLIFGAMYIRERNQKEAKEKFEECLMGSPDLAAKWYSGRASKDEKGEIIDFCNELMFDPRGQE